jgi:hypothetical protein
MNAVRMIRFVARALEALDAKATFMAGFADESSV